MPGSLNIPLVTLPVGTRDSGSAAVPDSDSEVMLLIDRTVTNGMNSQPSTTSILIISSQSNDGGNTWLQLSGSGAFGGIIISKYTGNPETGIGVSASLRPGTNRRIKASVTIAGTSVAVQGVLSWV